MKVICILKTWGNWRDLKMFFIAWLYFGALYIAHDYTEQKSYTKGKKEFFPLKCDICGTVSTAWRYF